MPTLIVDASVAVKWFFREADSPAAQALRRDDVSFIAPELIIAEIGNAAWKKQMRDEIDGSQVVFVVRQATLIFENLVPISKLAEEAAHLSANLRHPIYDCLYVALAQREQCSLVSADARMLAIARNAKVQVHSL